MDGAPCIWHFWNLFTVSRCRQSLPIYATKTWRLISLTSLRVYTRCDLNESLLKDWKISKRWNRSGFVNQSVACSRTWVKLVEMFAHALKAEERMIFHISIMQIIVLRAHKKRTLMLIKRWFIRILFIDEQVNVHHTWTGEHYILSFTKKDHTCKQHGRPQQAVVYVHSRPCGLRVGGGQKWTTFSYSLSTCVMSVHPLSSLCTNL